MTRNRLIALAAAAALSLAAIGCAPPPTTPTVPTVPGGWLAAGCFDGAGGDGAVAPDLAYNGTANQAGNATVSALIVAGMFQISGNGTCAGQPVGAITIVQGADQAAADAVCSALGQGTAKTFVGTAWPLPADAWSCTNTILL